MTIQNQVIVKRVALADITKVPSFQSRKDSALKEIDLVKVQRDQIEHIERFQRFLELSPENDTDPVELAEINGVHTLIDGHHRCAAYERAERTHIPATVTVMTEDEAFARTRKVNAHGVKLPMHKDQVSEASWQLIAVLTKGGKRELPKGVTVRSIAEDTQCPKSTVHAQIQRMNEWPKIAKKFKKRYEDKLDSYTGVGLWRLVRNPMALKELPPISRDDLREKHIQKIMKKIAEMNRHFAFLDIREALNRLDPQDDDEGNEGWVEEEGKPKGAYCLILDEASLTEFIEVNDF